VYGLHGRNFLLTVRRLAQERRELRIVVDQFGTPTWSATVAAATVNALKTLQTPAGVPDMDRWREQAGLYHLSARGGTSWYGFAQAIVEQCVPEPKPEVIPIKTADYPAPAQRPVRSVLSSEKFIRAFGSLPIWDEAFKACLAGQREAL